LILPKSQHFTLKPKPRDFLKGLLRNPFKKSLVVLLSATTSEEILNGVWLRHTPLSISSEE
jgi:hypothetical protein